MKELANQINSWIREGKPFALARVIGTWGSSPRPVGSAMIISEDMEMAGSVSGGCVEGAVVKESKSLIENGGGKKIAYGVSDEDAWAVGLSCGGKLQVYLEQFMSFDKEKEQANLWESLSTAIDQNKSCALVTKLEDGINRNTVVHPDGRQEGAAIDKELVQVVLKSFKERRHITVEHLNSSYFVHVIPKRSQLLIIGAAHITVDLIELAKMYDFEVIVIDPRGAFANKTQFNVQPDQIIEAYPSEVLENFDLDPFTYAVILSHDPKIDDNALQILLPSDVAYIGALGSRKTHAKRVQRLLDHGFSQEDIDRVDAPIGLDMNAKSPKEIAMSIMGAIIQAKNQFN